MLPPKQLQSRQGYKKAKEEIDEHVLRTKGINFQRYSHCGVLGCDTVVKLTLKIETVFSSEMFEYTDLITKQWLYTKDKNIHLHNY
jgi:hypothetical protein